MSGIDQSVEKEAISDYSDIFQEDIDSIKTTLEELEKGFTGLDLFYAQDYEDEEKKDNDKNEKGGYIYQYDERKQKDFIINKFKVSSKLDTVFPVVKDINEIFTISSKQLQEQGEATTQGTPQNVVNVVPAQQQARFTTPSFLSKFTKQQEGGLPKNLEDAWNRTQEWQITTMNIPNLWSKYLDWHEKGIIRQFVFEEGMEPYLKIERWYLQAILEPNITKMVQRGLMLAKDKKLLNLKEIYSGTLEKKAQGDQFALFAGMQAQQQKSKNN